jgi:hypothetical protein
MAGQLHPLAGQLVPYPHPEHETTDSLAVRAQLSADALITLNKQARARISHVSSTSLRFCAQSVPARPCRICVSVFQCARTCFEASHILGVA